MFNIHGFQEGATNNYRVFFCFIIPLQLCTLYTNFCTLLSRELQLAFEKDTATTT